MTRFLPAMFAVMFAVPTVDGAGLPRSLDLSKVRSITVQHDGRWPPLDTLARDLVWSVTGKTRFEGHDPVLLVLAWSFDVQRWIHEPLFSIGSAELRRELELSDSKDLFSFMDLAGHKPLLDEIEKLRRLDGGEPMDPLQSKVSEIHQRLIALDEILGGRALFVIPNAQDASGPWRPMALATMPGSQDQAAAQTAWAALEAAFLADDAAGFAAASDQLAGALEALPAAFRPDAKSTATELRYNRLDPFGIGWILMAVGAAFALLALAVRRRGFDLAAALPLIAGFAIVTYGILLRWQIAGRVPASNMYESLLFLGWGVGLFAVLAMLTFKSRLVPLTASIMAALALFLADILPLDPFVRPPPPVLMDTVWMAIHVPIIMVSYSVLAIGVLIAHLQVVGMALAPGRTKLATALDDLHYWYIHVGSILLLAGIVTGSMWGASSWGRYWGWDPKEVWSLVALLGYLTILHVRLDSSRVPVWAYVVGGVLVLGVIGVSAYLLHAVTLVKSLSLVGAALAVALFVLAHGRFATAVKSILCFWLILMTYVGVNFVLGMGLHSYGFGKGAVVYYMFLCGGSDLALLTVFSLLYLLWGRRSRSVGISLPQVSA